MGFSGLLFFVTLLVETTCGGCPTGWSSYGNNCYTVFTQATNIPRVTEARVHCRLLRGDLATIRSGGENTFLTNLLNNNGTSEAFIGGNDNQEEMKFTWFDDSPFTWTNWDSGEPNDYPSFNGENCVSILSSGYWNDVPCQFNPRNIKSYICEKSETETNDEHILTGLAARKQEYVFSGYMLRSITVHSSLACVAACVHEGSCISVNFDRRASFPDNCVLNYSCFQEDRFSLASNSTFDYYELRPMSGM